MTTKAVAAAAKLKAMTTSRTTAQLIEILSLLDAMPYSHEARIITHEIFDELEGRMTPEQEQRYDALYEDDRYNKLGNADLFRLAFEAVAA